MCDPSLQILFVGSCGPGLSHLTEMSHSIKAQKFFTRPLWANPELYPVVCAVHGE